MDRKNLENRCSRLYGEEKGKNLSDSIIEIADKDFCVATAWNDHQISIAKTCKDRGKKFELSPNYDSLILTKEESVLLTNLTYNKINKHLLDKSYGHIEHCKADLPGN